MIDIKNRKLQIALLPVAFLIFSVLSNLFLPQACAFWGYIFAILFTPLFAKKHLGFLFPLLSLIFLSILSGTCSFFIKFFSQTELYTIYEFLDGSLFAYLFGFNTILTAILGGIGIYASIPSKKAVLDDTAKNQAVTPEANDNVKNISKSKKLGKCIKNKLSHFAFLSKVKSKEKNNSIKRRSRSQYSEPSDDDFSDF